MYKLTVVAGPSRGTSYAIQNGEVSIGRQSGNTVVLSSGKVSKRHCVLVVDNTGITLQDQESANGTFVNGVLTKEKKIGPGDRISVGEFILEVTDPQQNAQAPRASNVIRFPVVQSNSQAALNSPGDSQSGLPVGLGGELDSSATQSQAMPEDIKGKILWGFDNYVMPFFYGLNFKTEWRFLVIGIFGIFALVNLYFSIQPLLLEQHRAVIREVGRRATFMAREIADRNAPYIAANTETKTELGAAEHADGVQLALLTDMEGRVIAPANRLNSYYGGSDASKFSLRARDIFRKGFLVGQWTEIGGSVVAVEPVRVVSNLVGQNVAAGMAIVIIDGRLSTSSSGEDGVTYSSSLILTAILGALLLMILYRLTIKPLQVLNEDLEKALKGDLAQVTHEFKFDELNSLWDLINSAIQRIPKSDEARLQSATELSPAEDFVGPIRMIGDQSTHGVLLLDSQRRIAYLNSMFEEITGIRSEIALGQELGSVARDQSIGVFTNDLIERAAVGGAGATEDYEFSGISYKVHVAPFGSPTSGAKAYIMFVTRVES